MTDTMSLSRASLASRSLRPRYRYMSLLSITGYEYRHMSKSLSKDSLGLRSLQPKVWILISTQHYFHWLWQKLCHCQGLHFSWVVVISVNTLWFTFGQKQIYCHCQVFAGGQIHSIWGMDTGGNTVSLLTKIISGYGR
jgi:hypothetical protein